jgi:CBS domain-containing protein
MPGVLPVGENDRLVGMITYRDIAVRAVAAGKSPDIAIREIMSGDVCYCFDDQDISDVAANMGDELRRDGNVREREVDRAVESTFPASDPTASGRATSTEPATRPVDRQAPVISREDIERASGRGRREAIDRPIVGETSAARQSPGDDAAPGTPGTGEDVCPQCKGTGRIKARLCPNCEGVGKVTKGIGGA